MSPKLFEAVYLQEHVRRRFDLLLEQNTQRPVLLLQVKDASSQFHTFLSQILMEQQQQQPRREKKEEEKGNASVKAGRRS